MYLKSTHPYNNNNSVYNFFFHPQHFSDKRVVALAVITHIAISILTCTIYQAFFWCVNRWDDRKLQVWKRKHENQPDSGINIPRKISDSLDTLFNCENVVSKIPYFKTTK